MHWQRIDPKGCGCTDCLTGYSIPIDNMSEEDVKRVVNPWTMLQDASGLTEKDWDEFIRAFEVLKNTTDALNCIGWGRN